MKINIIKPLIGSLFLCGFLLSISCEKDLPTYLEYESNLFSSIDENGGTWKPVLLNTATQISIEAPTAPSSEAYQIELNEVRQKTSNISSEQQNAIQYWTNNPIIRWNEVALELIAKYNLIPGPNPDGSYTLPDPNNPEGPPPFPFAHPPYACRALAYMSVAQFDGLISAWHYKYLYNREAPYKQNPNITYAYPDNNIPSYPSDGAVIARTSRLILEAMFPLEKEYLENLEKEHLNTLITSGSNTQSDIDAGIIIGNSIATVALERAASDGMKNAQTPKPVSDSIKAAAYERFGWTWENLEVPPRPVGLTPLFGKVKTWNVPDIEAIRPPKPPQLDSQEFFDDAEILTYYADNMTDEWRATANFWQDGLGTYTPPGHWNRFANEFITEDRFNPLRSARTMAYMNMAIMDGGIGCWDAKYYYHYPRPIQLIENFQTIAGTPNFPSYTSGHSVFSAAASEVLAYIFPGRASLVREWAEEAAISRVYGGIHWTFDAYVGTDQGREIARFTIDKAKQDGAD